MGGGPVKSGLEDLTGAYHFCGLMCIFGLACVFFC